MTGFEIIQKVKYLDFPQGSYVVYGSGPLALVGIREANDIDMLISQELYDTLRKKGWHMVNKGPLDKPVVKDDVECHPNWNFSMYRPTLEELLSRATIVDSVAFSSLQDVRKWKLDHDHSNRDEVLKQIDDYLKK